MNRIKYNRADLDSTMVVAGGMAERNNRLIYQSATMYVFATACGYTIEQIPPAFGQSHYKVYPDHAELIEQVFSCAPSI